MFPFILISRLSASRFFTHLWIPFQKCTQIFLIITWQPWPSCDAVTEFSHCSYSYELHFVITRTHSSTRPQSVYFYYVYYFSIFTKVIKTFYLLSPRATSFLLQSFSKWRPLLNPRKFYKIGTSANSWRRSVLLLKVPNQARATRCNFFPQVSADNSKEEADHIETSRTVSLRSAATFFSHVFVENEQLVHVKSQWRA